MALAQLAHRPREDARIILGMRSDYIGSAVTLPGLGEQIKRPWVLLPPGAEEVRAIVARPGGGLPLPLPGAIREKGRNLHECGLLKHILSDPLLGGQALGKGAEPPGRPGSRRRCRCWNSRWSDCGCRRSAGVRRCSPTPTTTNSAV